MFKRPDKDAQRHDCTPAKKPKLDISKIHCNAKENKDSGERLAENEDDVWGDDFAEDEIEQIDLVASQICQQMEEKTRGATNLYGPSTSKNTNSFTNDHNRLPSCNVMKPTRATNEAENTVDDIKMTQGLDFKNFEHKLLCKKYHNSTFHQENDIIISDNGESVNLERLKAENKKLLNDFITKDGETTFLRNQLQQAQLRSSNDRLEKTRSLEEQATRHRMEIEAICKEKENLETELKLKTLELGKLMEKCMLIENRNVKLIEPRTATVDSPSNRSRSYMPGSISLPVKNVVKATQKESSVQTNVYDKNTYHLTTLNTILDYPLSRISRMVFSIASPEKSIVDIKVIEKTGKRNLPILQEEETFRIFEKPDLVKPVVTMVNDKQLSVEFVLPNLYEIARKTNLEINSENFIPTINKLVATSRELMLNTIVVLRKISQAMKNDDIRDMNDLYLSDAYNVNMKLYHNKSECDAGAWHEGERGVEARRMIGVLSYVTLTSNYLSDYLSGKTALLVQGDDTYKCYSQQLIRYNTWSKKDHDFEYLEMILEFSTLVGYVRRSHQFSGLISAIAKLLCNVHEKATLCEKGVDYVYRIFRELVFARPLPICYVPLTRLLNTFVNCNTFVQRLCWDMKSTAINVWKGVLHFTPDACTLQIFIVQMEKFNADPVTIVNIVHPLISFVRIALQTNSISFSQNENNSSCNCCLKLLRFTLKMLARCAEMSFSATGSSKRLKEMYSENLSDEFWMKMEKARHDTVRAGIKFLCYLATCNPDFIVLYDVDNDFYSFLHNIDALSSLILHESEKEALSLIKATFLFDKPLCSDGQSLPLRQKSSLQMKMNQERRRIVSPSEKECKTDENRRKCCHASSTFKASFRTKLSSND